MTGKRERRSKQLPDGLKETRRYQKLKEVALHSQENALGETTDLSQGGILVDETPDNIEDDCDPCLNERIIWLITRSNS
jgi:hypothetical protein